MIETEAKLAENPKPVGNPNAADAAVKHGYWRAKAALERGLSIIPSNSPLHAFITERREAIIADRGGRANLSHMLLDLIEKYITTEILISSADAYLMALEQPRVGKRTGRVLDALGIIDRRSHKLRPIVEQRNRLIETSLKLANAIGLQRAAAPVPDLQTFLRQRAAERAPESKISQVPQEDEIFDDDERDAP